MNFRFAGSVLSLGALFLLVGMSAQGQDEGEPEAGRRGPGRRVEGRGADRFLEGLARELGLEGEQLEKVRAAFEESQNAVRESYQKRDEKIRDLLDEEQAKRYDALRREAQGRMRPGGRGEGERGGPRGSSRSPQELIRRALGNLELTEEQQGKVREILSEIQGEIEALVSSAREEGADPRDLRGKIEALRATVLEKVRPILTEEQLAKLGEMGRNVERRILEGRRGGEDRRGGREGDPEQRLQSRLEAIQNDLDVIPEVWAVLGEKVEGILREDLRFREAARERGRSLRERMESGEEGEEDLLSAMREFREERKRHEATLQDLREDLRQLLSLREEAKLVLHGVLD